jgi:hypothetical protein
VVVERDAWKALYRLSTEAYLFSFAQLLGAVLCTWCEVGRALYG